MNEDIIISNPELFEMKLSQIKKDGLNSLHVVSDFDRTVTKCYVNGEKTFSVYGLIRQKEALLTSLTQEFYQEHFADIESYAVLKGETPLTQAIVKCEDVEKRMFLYYYNEFEIQHDKPFELRYIKMTEWWKRHLFLFAHCGLKKEHLDQILSENKRIFRDEFFETMAFCKENDMPILFFSAGIQYMIEEFLKLYDALTSNVHILSNNYTFGDDGVVNEISNQIIHVFSKGNIDVASYGYTDIVKDHQNVLLLGDSLSDIDMIKNIPHKTALKIGFLNEKVEENLERYKEVYDVLILNDGSFALIIELLTLIKSPA